MKFKPPRSIERTKAFEENYARLKEEGAFRIEEWIESCIFTLSRYPSSGVLAGRTEKREVYINKQFDLKSKRYISLYHTYDDEKVVFFEYYRGGSSGLKREGILKKRGGSGMGLPNFCLEYHNSNIMGKMS